MTFQNSQGNTETLFKWGGKRLHDFAANLSRKLCITYYHNCLNFTEYITKKTFWSLFSWHSVVLQG